MFHESNAQAIKIQSEQQRIVDLTNNLNNFLRATTSNHNHSDNFYAEYSAFLSEFSDAFHSLSQYTAISAAPHAQVQEQARTRNAEFAKNSEEISIALDTKRRELEEAQVNVRKTTDAFNPKLFVKLKVKETPALTTLFNNLHQTYYLEQEDVFDWASFKKAEVEKNKLVDFNNRLINADYNKIPQERIEALDSLNPFPTACPIFGHPYCRKKVKICRAKKGRTKNKSHFRGLFLKYHRERVKTDAELIAIGAKKDSSQVLELINFLGLVKGVADLQRAIAKLKARLEGLREEQQAYDQASVAANQFAQKRNEDLTALSDRMAASAALFGNIEQRTIEQRQAYEDHKRKIRNLVDQTESQPKSIPKSIYNEYIDYISDVPKKVFF